jgi:hypothetical protein
MPSNSFTSILVRRPSGRKPQVLAEKAIRETIGLHRQRGCCCGTDCHVDNGLPHAVNK